MFWLGMLLTSAFTLLGVGVVVHGAEIRRHFDHPALVVGVVATGCAVAVPGSLSIAMSARTGCWGPYASGVEMLAFFGMLALLVSTHRSRDVAARPRRILVVGAHPDDLEIGCGGSLARFADQGHQVMAMVMSRGGRGGNAEIRQDEAVNAAQSLELAGLSVQDFTDTRMATEIGEMIRVIETAVNIFEPDLIITHSSHDQHQDHHAVHLATMRAARQCPTILCFESPSVTSDFTARYYVDIGDYMDVKIDAVRRHQDQAGKPYMGADRLRGTATFRGGQAKVTQAEGFEVMRALSSGLGDL